MTATSSTLLRWHDRQAMSIARLTAYHVCIPLKRPVQHASHSRTETDSLVVRCELDDGHLGWGEGLPRAYVTGESIDDAWAILSTANVAEQLSDSLESLPETIERLNKLRLLPMPGPAEECQFSKLKSQIGDDRFSQVMPFVERGCLGNSARCAIELAVLDAVSRRKGVPLSRVTEMVAECKPIHQQLSHVHYSGVITAESPRQQIRSALKQRLYGFRQIKVKVGVDGHNDAVCLRRIRRIVGRRVDIRIDVNEAWSSAELIERLQPLLPMGITAVEQPVPHTEIGALARHRDHLEIPVMFDESLCSIADGQRAIDEGLCDLFNIRLSKCGGFLPSLRLAALAHQAGLGYQLGCQVGETGILSAAGRNFAISVAGIRYLEGSYDRHLVCDRLTREDLTFGYGGCAPALAGPGLGVSIDGDAVQRVTRRRLELL